MISAILAIVGSYLLGSIASAIVVSRVLGLPDPRLHGSKNPGATNVLRLGNKVAAVWVLLGDSLKGLVPVLIAKAIGLDPWIVGLVGLAAFLGHLFPLFYRFQGGKGVATAMGVWLGLAWALGGLAIITWGLIAGLFRYSSLAAIVTAIVVPIYALWLLDQIYIGPLLILSALLIARHRANIRRLVQGQESRIGVKHNSSD